MYFWTYRLGKTLLEICLKSRLSEDPWTSNLVNGPKLCWNLNNSTFTIFIDPRGNTGLNSLSKWYAKSLDSLLTHWLPKTSFFFLIETIYSNIFRCNYLRNEKYFLFSFFFPFLNLGSSLKLFKKKMTFIADVFLNLMSPKHCTVDIWTRAVFIGFLDHCAGYSPGKTVSEWYAKCCDCLLTHSLLITSILFLIEKIYCIIYRCKITF